MLRCALRYVAFCAVGLVGLLSGGPVLGALGLLMTLAVVAAPVALAVWLFVALTRPRRWGGSTVSGP